VSRLGIPCVTDASDLAVLVSFYLFSES